MKIVIGFSKPIKKSFHGWLIEKIDNSTFDHAYLRFTLDKFKRDVVFQSIAVGVQLVSVPEFEGKCLPVEEYELDLTEDQFIKMFQFCIDNAGKPYGLLDVLGLGISKLLCKLGIKKKNPFFEGDANYFCSQIVIQCLDSIDPKDFNFNADNISPKDLNTIVKSLNLKRIL